MVASVVAMVADPPNTDRALTPVLVVGGTGHVGSPLCLHLAENGRQVTAASRRPSPGFNHPLVDEIRLDLRHPTSGLCVESVPIAVICPLVLDGEAAPNWITKVVDHLSKRGLRSVLSFSTVWVYGTLAGRLTEASPARPTNHYGKAHLANEQALWSATERHGIDVTILRMSNLVGADPFYGQRSKISFTHELADMALTNARIVLRSPASTPRDLLARARLHHLIDAVLARAPKPGRYEVLNVGGGVTTTVGEFAQTVADAAARYHGRPVVIEHPDDPDNKPTFDLDSSRIEEVSGPHPNDLHHEVSLVIRDVLKARGENW
ncbi:MAG: hypothetical protein CL467_03555 [Acidimicrobiaceae bacterium]|nr:hypothetical protein [Acidimicrobiaceae bacterium]